jgi:hypothetical protein
MKKNQTTTLKQECSRQSFNIKILYMIKTNRGFEVQITKPGHGFGMGDENPCAILEEG